MLLTLALVVAASGAEPIRLDAGPASAPVLDDFARLDPSGSEDPRVRWLVAPTGSRDVRAPDPLAGDAIVGGTLHLDVPAGTWQIAAMLGDPVVSPEEWSTSRFGVRTGDVDAIAITLPDTLPAFLASEHFSPNPRPVFLPTQTAFDRVVLPQTPWRRAVVEVGTDGLTVSAWGRPLRALVVTPADVDLDAELALIDARRARWWTERVHPSPDRLPPVVDGPLTLTTTPISARDPGEVETGALHLARGDRASRLLWVGGGDQGGTVDVDAPRDLDVRTAEVTWLDGTVHTARPLVPRPRVVQSPGPFRGGQGVPPVLALDVRSRPDARPGRHLVTVRVHRGDETARVDVVVIVHPVDVDRRLHGGLFSEVPHAPRLRLGLDAPETRRLLEEQLALFADLGLDALSLRNATGLVDGVPETTTLTEAGTRWKALGGHALVWPDPLATLRWTPHTTDATLATMLHAASPAAVPVWVTLFEEDDWRQEGALALGRERLERARRLDPTALRLVIPSTPLGWPLASDAAVAFVGGERDLLRAGIEAVRGRGAVAWAYNLAPGASGPLLAWAAGADGLLEWHADMLPHDPFDDVVPHDRRTHVMLGPDGVLHATTALLDLADGLADARLLSTLQARLPRLRPELRREAERLIATTRAALLAAVASPGADGALLPLASRDAIRARVLGLLARVPKGKHHPA